MSRVIDIDDDRNHYIGMDGEYEQWNIDPNVLAEAQPERKPRKWIIYTVSMLDGEDCKCPECGQTSCAPYWHFCPNCGLKMEGVEQDG